MCTHTPGVIFSSADHKGGHSLLIESQMSSRHRYGLQNCYKHVAVGLWIWTGAPHKRRQSMQTITACKQETIFIYLF